MFMVHKNIFYFSNINSIGGVEAFFYYLVKKYQNKDIVVYYKNGDAKQLERLRQYIRCIKWNGHHIKCEKAFFNYNPDIIDYVDAKEYIQVIHADYKVQRGLANFTNSKITKYIAVSQLACDSFTEVTGKPCELCYNPIILDKPKRMLRLVSATRLTSEKGRPRMIKLAEMLDKAGIPYLWTIFTNDSNIIRNPNVIYMKPRLDISDYIANSDYLVQLSDCEAFCYSVVESLMLGVPVIVTDLPVFEEIGLNDENSFRLKLNMTDVPIEEIYKKKFNFKYQPPKDNWDNILAKGENTWDKERDKIVEVECIRPNGYDDIVLNKRVIFGEKIKCTMERADHLKELGLIK